MDFVEINLQQNDLRLQTEEILKKQCEIFKPITWGSGDTPLTVQEVKEYNAVREDFCR